MSAQTADTAFSSNPAFACAAAESRQFDFWIGEWEVSADGKHAGRSRIQSILGGCAILENWSGASGNEGKSLNTWNAAATRWEQYWVDGSGTPLHLIGGIVDGRMVLSGRQSVPDPQTGRIRIDRITWTPNADGSVRQLWESSDDDGGSWTTSFDGLYRKAADDSPSHT
ncbi:MAG TPA: hypothetical protein VGH80_03215 [Xanthomonadaceae bacterium]|jgi:hypothetical protein